jgi:SpoVK/Ycf46/Vps4 family AAA+-type ATPase
LLREASHRNAEYGHRIKVREDAADQSAAEQPVSEDDQIVQPEGVDLEAESLLDTSPGRGFSDVGGMSELKETLQKTVLDPVEQPDRFAEYGLGTINGVLLHGCLKNYVTGALAGELGYYFLEVTPADVTSRYMGEPAQNVEEVFLRLRVRTSPVSSSSTNWMASRAGERVG